MVSQQPPSSPVVRPIDDSVVARETSSSGSALAASPAGSSPPAETSGCPTPLAWQQVVKAFHEKRQIHRLSLDGRDTAVWTLGQGPPLYLMNGFVGDASLLALFVWLLQEEHTCVVCDWSQFHDDRPGDARQRLENLSQSVLRMADSLGHDKVALHATSFGCLVGLQVMLDAPDRIAWASLQGGFAARRFSWTEKGLIALARRSGRSMGEFRPVAVIQEQNHRRWFPPFDITRWSFYERQMGNTPVGDVARLASIAGGADLRPRLSDISTPVLLVGTEGDGAVATRAQEELAGSLVRCTVEYLDNCGTLPHLTHPHRLAKLLRKFRDATAGSSATGDGAACDAGST